MRVLILIFILLISSCGYKTVDFDKTHSKICVKKVNINSPEPVLLDSLNQSIRDALIAKGYQLDCSYKKNYNMYVNVKSISFYPIGYSQAQRANVYKANITVNIKLETKEGNAVLNKDITETTQYIGAGLRTDIERRYAVKELANLIQIRIFSLLLDLK